MIRYETIIWDWNGTLLNDVDTCIQCMNILLQDRKIPMLDHKRYLEIFTFPVKDYYIQAGFDLEKEPFEVPAHQFIDLYRKEVLHSPLHGQVQEVLAYLQGKGYIQVILSAMERDFLLQTMGDKGIMQYFRGIYGIDNHLGAGKTMAASQLMKELSCDPKRTLVVGDTLHDAEIANELGVSCVLVAHGHQSFERLLVSGHPVVHSLRDLMEFL